ncbi:MAG: UspA protein [Ferruginibacter sp.]|nr:UspA protein [Ferruginibacter sp.]
MINYNINKILVAIDFSPASLNALDTAVAMANRHAAAILLVNVVEIAGLAGFTGDNQVSTEEMKAMTQHSEEHLRKLQHSIKARYIMPCEIIAVAGGVSSSIIQICRDQNADIVVIGAHGSSGYRDSVIGSNAFNVIKNAVCPVLTIPEKKKYESFKKILFPVRPVPHALQKYDFVQKMVSKDDATLKVLGLARDGAEDIDLVKTLTARLKEKLEEDHVEAATYYKVGENMEEEVVKIASLMGADLIVLTAENDSLYDQLIVGTYTRHVINHAHLPVLCIKPMEESVEEEELHYDGGAGLQQMSVL